MLVSLHVKNLALIDETEVWFGEGLNILTGETGAGKSVIIGSVALALGAKADKELIRTGAEYALVELVFQIDREEQLQAVSQMDLAVGSDGEVILSRRIMPGRSVCKVNGEAVSAKEVKELAEYLIDIHGQHEHQSLLHKNKQFEILDDFAGEELCGMKEKLKGHYERYRQLKLELQENELDENSRKKELSLAEFEAQEIREADLIPGEDEQLEQKYRRILNARKIGEAAAKVYAFTGYDEENGAGNLTGRALRELRSVMEYDGILAEYEAELTQIDSLLNDFNREMSDYLSNLDFDQNEFQKTEERLNLLNRLKDKYGNTLEEVLHYGAQMEEKCKKLLDYEAYRMQLEKQFDSEEAKLAASCKKLSECRKRKARELAGRMEAALVDLNFLHVQFQIEIRPEEKRYTERGFDEVEFMISTNPGEPLKPLSNVASGGELSRIMLALKTVLADRDHIGTLIFDEIDAGISGKTAWKVSEKMAVLGKNHQLICITHLPQIAAMADKHFVIEKSSDKNSTRTDIRVLKQEEELLELARLLGGADVTENTLKTAGELKEQAERVKNDKNC